MKKKYKEMTDEMYYCKTRTNREIIMEFQKGNHSNTFKGSVRVRWNETKSIPCIQRYNRLHYYIYVNNS